MGEPKALLELGGTTFLARIIEALRKGGCDPVIVVAGGHQQPMSANIAGSAAALGAIVITNPDPESEQVDSIRLAIEALPPNIKTIVVSPVDAPLIRADTVSEMILAASRGAPIVVPVSGGRRGHPILFSGSAIDALLQPDLPEGARSVVDQFADQVVEVETDNGDVLLDVDTPEDYRRLRDASQ